MKIEVDIQILELLRILIANLSWCSDSCLDDLRTKINNELDKREFTND